MGGSGSRPSLLHGMIDQAKSHGPIFGFYFGKTPAVVIADYNLVRYSEFQAIALLPETPE